MVDTNLQGGSPAGSTAAAQEDLRVFSIIIYALYLAAFCNGLTAIIGVILAYVKRGDASGTPYESHFTNAIEVFWISLVVALVAIPLIFLFGLGLLVYCGLVVWYLYRTIKGLVRTIDRRAF